MTQKTDDEITQAIANVCVEMGFRKGARAEREWFRHILADFHKDGNLDEATFNVLTAVLLTRDEE